MSEIPSQSLNGLFKEVYADSMANLIYSSDAFKYLDPNYDPYIDKLQKQSLSNLKEILCLPR